MSETTQKPERRQIADVGVFGTLADLSMSGDSSADARGVELFKIDFTAKKKDETKANQELDRLSLSRSK